MKVQPAVIDLPRADLGVQQVRFGVIELRLFPSAVRYDPNGVSASGSLAPR